MMKAEILEAELLSDSDQDEPLVFCETRYYFGTVKGTEQKELLVDVSLFPQAERQGMLEVANSYRESGYAVIWIGTKESDPEFPFGMDPARDRRKRQCEQSDADHGQFPHSSYRTISNVEVMNAGTDEEVTVPFTLRELRNQLIEQLFDWPRRIGSMLFVPDTNGRVHFLGSADELVSWLSRFGLVEWQRKQGCVSQAHLYHELVRSAPEYLAVEPLMHEPKMGNTYYSCRDVAPGDGKVFDELLDAFSPDTESDREIIRSLFVTPFWGGEPGTRPAFLVTAESGRGAGKSKLAQLVGQLAGGILDFSSNEEIEVIKQRLLTPDATSKRVALLDNIKSMRFSFADWEAIVTADTISGKRLYHGDASRRNTITWILTLNGASLSTDVAQRVVEIKLARPHRDGLWEERVRRLIRDRRNEIIADIVGVLRRPAVQLARHSRWATWEAEVLGRMAKPNELLRLIEERRGIADVEADEAVLVEEYFAAQLTDLHFDAERERVHIPVTIAADWFRRALGEPMTTTAASRRLGQLIAEGRLGRFVGRNPSRTHGRGFVWEGVNAEPQREVTYELETRIDVLRIGR